MKTQNSKLKTQNGFTLIEVVVAMAIVGLGVVTLLEIFSSGLRLGTRGFEKTETIVQSRRIMDEVLARGELRDGTEEGSFAGGHRWRLYVESPREAPAMLAPAGWELKEMTLEVRQRDGRHERLLEMKTLRLIKRKST